MELSKYNENYGILEYQLYVIIVIDMKNNIIYFKVIDNKINAFDKFNIKEYGFLSCYSIEFYIDYFKILLNSFDNNTGILNLIGFNSIFDILYIEFCTNII